MTIKLLELVLVATVALGIGFWQLYDINKELKKDRDQGEATASDGDQAALTSLNESDDID